jgi:hypothetical protein
MWQDLSVGAVILLIWGALMAATLITTGILAHGQNRRRLVLVLVGLALTILTLALVYVIPIITLVPIILALVTIAAGIEGIRRGILNQDTSYLRPRLTPWGPSYKPVAERLFSIDTRRKFRCGGNVMMGTLLLAFGLLLLVVLIESFATFSSGR